MAIEKDWMSLYQQERKSHNKTRAELKELKTEYKFLRLSYQSLAKKAKEFMESF
jgi:hypothetical protein